MPSNKSGEKILRALIREALTATDKRDVEAIAKKQAKKHFDKFISSAIEDEIGRSYFGTRGKINKFVDSAITDRFKNAKNDKDFDDAVIKISKRVLKALYDMHFKRNNLIDNMPVSKA